MTPRTRSALADLRSLADAAESADLMLMAHGIRRAARDIEADLTPVVVEQEDDGDPELAGERIDPAVFALPTMACSSRAADGSWCVRGEGHTGAHVWPLNR